MREKNGRNNINRRKSITNRNNTKLSSSGSKVRAEVNARRKRAPPEPESGYDVDKPENRHESVPLILLLSEEQAPSQIF